MILDPERKSDPFNAMSYIGKVAKSDDKKVNAQKTLAKLIADVVAEYNDCTAVPKPVPAKPAAPKVVGKAKVLVSKLNVRNKPVDGKVVDTLDKNEEVTVYAIDTKSGWYIIDAAKTKFISNDKDYTALKK
jgi:uncharacterized protein YgiM (DUF1202 family)